MTVPGALHGGRTHARHFLTCTHLTFARVNVYDFDCEKAIGKNKNLKLKKIDEMRITNNNFNPDNDKIYYTLHLVLTGVPLSPGTDLR